MNKTIVYAIILSFIVNNAIAFPAKADRLILPKPGSMVHLSPAFNPPVLKGIKVHPENPFRFDFILDKGDRRWGDARLKEESNKLVKYFLASLTIPEKDLWVNLSPYEKDRIMPANFGQTEMGNDLLAEDYILKQITASLIYPADEIGKEFWKRIYAEAAEQYGTTDIPFNTFNKVWIVPQKAVVYDNAKTATAYVVESRFKVMLEQDYLSLEKNQASIRDVSAKSGPPSIDAAGSNIIRQIVIPALEREVNEGRNFSQLRQLYHSLILATWYKKKIKDSIFEQAYSDKGKVAGIKTNDPREIARIYKRYLLTFKKGVYSFIKEEIDPVTRERLERKYFSGGATFLGTANILETVSGIPDAAMIPDDRAMMVLTEERPVPSGQVASEDGTPPASGLVRHADGFQRISGRIPQPGKRTMDIILASLLLVAAIPLFIVIAIAIKWSSPGVVIYRTDRYGLNGEVFRMYKFRTMVANADTMVKALLASGKLTLSAGGGFVFVGEDPRVTKIGKILRLTKMDELPQLINVFLGNMSLVGPRPLSVDVGVLLSDSLGLHVLPGMTGVQQLRDPDGHQRQQWDEQYVRQWSLMGDVRIMMETFFMIVKLIMIKTYFKISGQHNNRKTISIAPEAITGIVPDPRGTPQPSQAEQSDGSQAQAIPGGIDLTSDKAVTVQNKDQCIKFHIDPAMLQQLQHAPGLEPVIINIQPAIDLRLWLGLDESFPL